MKKKNIKINLFGTLYNLSIELEINKRVPKFVTVKPETKWIYAGHKFEVQSVYMENNRFAPERGRSLRIILEGTTFENRGYKTTVIDEIDLIPHY